MQRNLVRCFVRSKAPLLNGSVKQVRHIAFSTRLRKDFNFPTPPDDMPRSGGIASMMRLPIQRNAQGLDVCFVGIPMDSGASNRSGTRSVIHVGMSEWLLIDNSAGDVTRVQFFLNLGWGYIGDKISRTSFCANSLKLKNILFQSKDIFIATDSV